MQQVRYATVKDGRITHLSEPLLDDHGSSEQEAQEWFRVVTGAEQALVDDRARFGQGGNVRVVELAKCEFTGELIEVAS